MELSRTLRVLAGMPSRINTLVAPLTEEQLSWRPAADEWSIKEVLCHLRDASDYTTQRVQLILSRDNPPLPAYDQEALARERRYQEELSPPILPRYAEHRLASLEALSGAPEAAFSRKGTHPEDGEMTLAVVVENAVKHEREHWEQIKRLKQDSSKR